MRRLAARHTASLVVDVACEEKQVYNIQCWPAKISYTLHFSSKGESMMDEIKQTSSWADLGAALYERLHERNAVITYAFENLEVEIPAGPDQPDMSATWKINGTIQNPTLP